MKPTSTFKLDRQTKRLSAKFLDSHERGQYIRMMIDAQLAYDEGKRNVGKFKDNSKDSEE